MQFCNIILTKIYFKLNSGVIHKQAQAYGQIAMAFLVTIKMHVLDRILARMDNVLAHYLAAIPIAKHATAVTAVKKQVLDLYKGNAHVKLLVSCINFLPILLFYKLPKVIIL